MNEQTQKYRIRNGRSYNAALVDRGSLTVWWDEAVLERWHETERTGRRGAPKRDSDWAVPWGWVMRDVFHGPLRALEGLPRSLLALLRVTLNTPDDSTFSRRATERTVWIGRRARSQPRHVVIDATGLKVHGEGEWTVRQHGASRRRTWRKLHLAVDADSHEVVAAELTAAFVGDAEVLPNLLAQRFRVRTPR
ncbi:MAG TPA: IS5 family transposase [Candidatus Competibacter phosphatis]|nr:IS5 family transposase [Candidatus Competibacter phosphatis]